MVAVAVSGGTRQSGWDEYRGWLCFTHGYFSLDGINVVTHITQGNVSGTANPTCDIIGVFRCVPFENTPAVGSGTIIHYPSTLTNPILPTYNPKTITTSQTLTRGTGIVYADATAGPITITLATTNLSSPYNDTETIQIKKTDTTINIVTIAGIIDGTTNFLLKLHNESVTLSQNGANWMIISHYNPATQQ